MSGTLLLLPLHTFQGWTRTIPPFLL